MSIFKIKYTATDKPHVYCQLFAAEHAGATWQLCGNLTMRIVEFSDFEDACPGVEFERAEQIKR